MNIILGEYIKKESILHQLDPRTKIIGSFSLILSFLFINTLIGYIITGILAFTLILLSKIPLKEFLKSLKYLLYILIFSSIFHILSHQDGKLLLQLGKFSIYDSGLMISVTLRFIPTILQEANTIKMSQQARGESFEGKNPFKKLYQYSLILLPLLVSVIQKVENLTLAMEARAFHCGLERTNFYKLEFQKRDYIAGIFIFLIISLFLVLSLQHL